MSEIARNTTTTNTITGFLTRTRGRGEKLDLTDMLTYLYLAIGTLVMFGPVAWLVLSSFKSEAEVSAFPPRMLPYQPDTVILEGDDEGRALFEITLDNALRVRPGDDFTVRLIDLSNQLVNIEWPDDSELFIKGGPTIVLPEFGWNTLLEDRAAVGLDQRQLLTLTLDEDSEATYTLIPEDGAEIVLEPDVPIDINTLDPVPDVLTITDGERSITWQRQDRIVFEGLDIGAYDLPFDVTETRQVAAGVGLNLLLTERPEISYDVPLNQRTAIEQVEFNLENYTEGVESFNFLRYFANSVFVTTTATLLTLFVNSMAAFALSKYQFPGRNAIFVVIISTLMVPLSVILVPAFLLITSLGWNNNLIGVIIPTIGTPTGVFLLRQYMLTIPDELIESARIDGASEWRIYLQLILPLSGPALAVLAIFSVMWRWNDFLWPKIVLTQSHVFTLQVGLESFQGEFNNQWHLILAMTVLSLLPITLVFGFLQRYITTGIATTGMK